MSLFLSSPLKRPRIDSPLTSPESDKSWEDYFSSSPAHRPSLPDLRQSKMENLKTLYGEEPLMAILSREDDTVDRVVPKPDELDTDQPVPTADMTRTPSDSGRPISCHAPDRMKTLTVPCNYAPVVPNAIYRSGFPLEENYSFVETLKLKTILTLVDDEPIPHSYEIFMESQGIKHFVVSIFPNKENRTPSPPSQYRDALRHLMNRENHPMLVHCNQGKHRTGTVIGCFRKTCGLDDAKTIDEYLTYSGHKARPLDMNFIKNFDVAELQDIASLQGWIESDDEEIAEEAFPTLRLRAAAS